MSQSAEVQAGDVARVATRAGTTWGIALVLLGILCIFAPFFAGAAVSMIVAVLLIAGGIARTAFAFKAESFGPGALMFLFGAVSILCGAVMLARPLLGLASLTAVLGFYFAADGILEIIGGFRSRPIRGWGWMVFAGALSLVLAILIFRNWPLSGAWAIGVLVGVNLLSAGWSMVMLGSMGDAALDEAGVRS